MSLSDRPLRQRPRRPLARGADVYIRPALPKVCMLQWSAYAQAVQRGCESALKAPDGEVGPPR